MLSQETIQIVKSTAPVLEAHGETLTRHFYKRMFLHNPEVAPFFNPAHQTAGLQQKALAAAICAYAANIDNLEVLGQAVELIAQKHASLQIKPEHYPIVGENLLASIVEVLGVDTTDAVIRAWAEAYEFLATILIGRETQIYQEHKNVPGGWEGFQSFRVIRKEMESEHICSFYLTPLDGRPLPVFKPGQYITVRIPSTDGQTTMRNYSLSDKPGQPWFRISVKREDGDKANTPEGYVSNFLHKHIAVDGEVNIAPPCGEFFIDLSENHQRPLVLLAAGIGITPILSILLSTLEATPNRQIVLIYGTLNKQKQAFKTVIDELDKKRNNLKVHYCYSEETKIDSNDNNVSIGFINAALIESIIKERDCDYYFCGPRPFMVGIYDGLLAWGIPPTQVHFEFFGPKQALER